MTDNQINSDDKQGQEPANQTPSNPPSGGDASEKTVPYERFKQVNEEFKSLKEQLAELTAAEQKRQADAETAEKKQLEEQNRFKELYETAEAEKAQANETLATLTAKVETMEKALTAQWDAQKELVPEMFRGLVEAMPIEQRIEWMSVNADKLTESKGNGTPRRVMSRGITPPTQSTNGPVGPSFEF